MDSLVVAGHSSSRGRFHIKFSIQLTQIRKFADDEIHPRSIFLYNPVVWFLPWPSYLSTTGQVCICKDIMFLLLLVHHERGSGIPLRASQLSQSCMYPIQNKRTEDALRAVSRLLGLQLVHPKWWESLSLPGIKRKDTFLATDMDLLLLATWFVFRLKKAILLPCCR